MLLNPLEKQLDFPTVFVELRNYFRCQVKVIGKIHKNLSGLRITVLDSPQTFGIIFGNCPSCQFNNLIALNSCRFVNFIGNDLFETQVLLYLVKKKTEYRAELVLGEFRKGQMKKAA